MCAVAVAAPQYWRRAGGITQGQACTIISIGWMESFPVDVVRACALGDSLLRGYLAASVLQPLQHSCTTVFRPAAQRKEVT